MPSALDTNLLDAVAENHREWFRRTAAAEGADVACVGGTELFVGREAMLFPSSELDVPALMREIRSRGIGSVGCWSLSANAALGTRLLARGFRWGWRPHWMAIDLERDWPEPTPARFAVVPATPPYARTLPYAPSGPAPQHTYRLGVRLSGKIVGHVAVNPATGVAGLYSMGVAPRARRRGIGMALIRAACQLAAKQGCRHAVVNATDEGTPLYLAAGFRSLGWGQTWWYSSRPEPAPREIALTEAVGFGDLDALDALEPTADELQAQLPGEESPLTLALLMDQPSIATYLLERCPQLAARRYPPHATTLLHLAAQHDRPAFAALALAHGVAPEARDDTFGATARGWAEHFGHTGIAQLLARLGVDR